MKNRILLMAAMMVILSGTIFASSYEWLRQNYWGEYILASGSFNVSSSNYDKFEWYPTTSGNYYEYRSLWYTGNGLGGWHHLDCDVEGYINGEELDQCYLNWTGFSPGPYQIAATTVWGGCDRTGFLSPGEADPACSDWKTINITLVS